MSHAGVLSASEVAQDFASQFYGAIDREDWSGLVNLFHPEVTYHRPGYNPFVGRENVMRFYKEQRSVAFGSHQVEKVVTRGEDVVCIGAFNGVSKQGEMLSVQFADVCFFQGGGVKERRTFFYVPAI